MSTRRRSQLLRYGVAVLTSFLALLLRFVLSPLLQEQAPLLVFIIPVMVSAWYGGLGPGLLSTLLSALVGTYFFLPPLFSTDVIRVADFVRLAIFFTEGILISSLSEALRLAKQRSEAIAKSLQASEEMNRLMVEGVKDYAIFMIDPEGYITSWNAGAERIKGYKAGEILGRHLSVLFPPEDVECHQPERELEIAMDQGQYAAEGWRRRKDGSLFWADTLLTALRDGAGNLRGFSKVTRDITERKHAQEALQRSADRIEALHDIDQAILAAQSSGELVRTALVRMAHLVPYQQAIAVLYNFETQTAQVLASSQEDGSSTAEPVVLPMAQFMADSTRLPDLADFEDNAAIQQCPSGLQSFASQEASRCWRSPLQVERTLIGELVLFLAPTTPLSEEYREIVTEVASQLAIALQQAQLREQLQAYAAELEQRVVDRTIALQDANEALEAFAHSISHDLRAPLRAMEGLAQALLEDYGDRLDTTGQDYNQRIVKAAQTMNTLIEDLLSYNRLSRSEIELRSLNLNTLMTDILTHLNAELQTQQAQVSVEFPLPTVMAHRATLFQVIANLITNATKFVALGTIPQVCVRAEDRNGWIRLWVEDNGIGIAPRYQERIFQPFERLHGVETYAGTGLGLAIVLKGVERMGGHVGVESQSGQGSRFWIELRGGSTDS